MSSIPNLTINRRALLIGGAGMAVAASLSRVAGAAATSTKEISLTAMPSRVSIVGAPHPLTDVWSYEGRIPGPEIHIRQGERVRIIVHNQLSEETTVHWHGVRVPNSMDGVPGLTQPPIKPGDQFAYEFTPPDAGTFWYHPHANGLQQLGRGMAGALIVEELEPVPVDRDIVWMLSDWRLTSSAQIAPGFGNGMEAGMAGRVGNTVTINGTVSEEVPVRAGERVRLRLVNCALARIVALRFEGHRPVVIAIDGQPCEPHEADRLLLGPAMRIDVMLDMQGDPGRRYKVIDDFYDGLSYWLTQLAYDEKPSVRAHPFDAPLSLPRNPLSEPNLAGAERHELRLQGGMMSMQGMALSATWGINGTSMTGDGHAGMPPLLTLKLGRSYLLTIRNETAWWHPMHLHGLMFRVLSRNGSPVPHRQWADTVLIPRRETADIAFVADNPGDWMLHCHVTDHQVSGMMTVLRIA
jgi:FtsP/CotA-like multicopper oxidase with cupredoxin domain